ncbi:MAG: HD domain-containing protein [bacterium]|nr:HD domain-containing protein [bacterium]
MELPNKEQCRNLYSRYHTPENIQDHMGAVAALGVELAQAIEGAGYEVNVALVLAAARLHDLVRIEEQWQYLSSDITVPLQHAEINYLILREKYPEVASVIRTHSLMTLLDEPDALESWENKIVYYADKRVNNDKIVTLEERLIIGNERWHVKPEMDQTDKILPKLKELEAEIFKSIKFLPEDLSINL